jgi:UDPglucose 6-dehydrogenase
MNIAVIGLGFVGLAAALGFADRGIKVRGYDTDAAKASAIKNGSVPFLEPGLPDALNRALGMQFAVAADVTNAVLGADAVFFCVGTPCGEDGKADLRQLLSAIDSVLHAIRPDCLLVVKSTVPPGTVAGEIIPHVRAKGFCGPVAANPEFLREGHCWEDFTAPARIVCGVENGDARAIRVLSDIYAPFHAPLYFETISTAEYVKYLSNALLATLISFSNEMAAIASATDAINISKAFKILHMDSRLQGAGIAHYIYPGCGYGGYCLPKDTAALSTYAKANGIAARILDAAIEQNDRMPSLAAEKLKQMARRKDAKIGILGLAFKPNSNDVRDSPAAKIIQLLLADGYADIYAYDPAATEAFREMYHLDISYCATRNEVCGICGTVAIVTAWSEFRGIDKCFPEKSIADLRYFL